MTCLPWVYLLAGARLWTGAEAHVDGLMWQGYGLSKALGVSAWGMNVLEIAPHCTNYPEHDHAKDGQEEVYTALEGTATLIVGGQTQVLKPGVLVRVGPSVTRKIITGDSGATILAIGATPGAVYAGR